jgi:hypothetical protein
MLSHADPRHARARNDRFLRRREDQAGPADFRVRGGPLEQPARSRPDLRGLQDQGLSERLGELEEELFEGKRARQPAAEGAKDLAGRIALGARQPVRQAGQPPVERLVEQRRDGGRGHRESEQRPLVGGREVADADHDHQVDGQDEAGETGELDRRPDQRLEPAPRLDRAVLPRDGHLTPPSAQAPAGFGPRSARGARRSGWRARSSPGRPAR